MRYICKRCGHSWLTRLEGQEPVQCPRCKRPGWNKETVRQYNRSVLNKAEVK